MSSIKVSKEEDIINLARNLFELKLEENRYANSQNISDNSSKKSKSIDDITDSVDKLAKIKFVLKMTQEITYTKNQEPINKQKLSPDNKIGSKNINGRSL